jgi:polyribonucleotide nucleotidyltransferase
MAEAISVTGSVGDDPENQMTFESGKLAGLADGAVLAGLGNTRILVTATASDGVREGIDFFPLTVDIEERSYAAGKIPGSFFRREGRAPDAAILTCRLIDRPLRPGFADGYRNETHIVGTVLGADQENPYDVLALNAASAALSMSGIPFTEPIGAVRLAFDIGGEWIPHPTYDQIAASSFDMVVAGRELDDGDVAVMMVEAGGTERSWENYSEGAPKVDEAALAGGLDASKQWIKAAIDLQKRLVEAVGGKAPAISYEVQADYNDEQYAAVESAVGDDVAKAMTIADKAERQAAEGVLKERVLSELLEKFAGDDAAAAAKQLKSALKSLTKTTVRGRIVNDGARIDGRGPRDLRPVSSEVEVIPTAHGSGLFQRGETQVLNVCTLGMQRMDQMIDGIDPTTKKRYMHHYNFPPFSTGEAGFMRGPKRREVGHGALAERAVFPVVPSLEEFPYTIRVVSEVLASNGSSSMGSVCSSSLSLMDAGVPIKAPIAGIAMGLVFAEGKYTTLTDILGAEDAFGDMDFKVAGSRDFVTALQLDTKIDGIPADVLAAALEQAKEARLAILDVMAEAIDGPRDDVSPTAPKIVSFEIPIDKIGEVIGPKGKVINSIQAETGADISVDDDGMVGVVAVSAVDRTVVEEAERQIRLILDPPTAEVGAIYQGKVVNITKFGAFVNILPGRDGLVHISKLGGGKRIDSVESVLSLGDDLEVRVEDIDPQGKVSLIPTSDGGDDPKASEASGAAASDAAADDDAAEASSAPARSVDKGAGESGARDSSGSDRSSDRPSRGRGRDSDGGRGSDRNRDSAPLSDVETVSFTEHYDAIVAEEHGDLGPAPAGNFGRRRRRPQRRR